MEGITWLSSPELRGAKKEEQQVLVTIVMDKGETEAVERTGTREIRSNQGYTFTVQNLGAKAGMQARVDTGQPQWREWPPQRWRLGGGTQESHLLSGADLAAGRAFGSALAL